jgi:hypothetical protein
MLRKPQGKPPPHLIHWRLPPIKRPRWLSLTRTSWESLVYAVIAAAVAISLGGDTLATGQDVYDLVLAKGLLDESRLQVLLASTMTSSLGLT